MSCLLFCLAQQVLHTAQTNIMSTRLAWSEIPFITVNVDTFNQAFNDVLTFDLDQFERLNIVDTEVKNNGDLKGNIHFLDNS